jgi:NAD(P)-dependent dehydrogenase (short-subunit alcohol dehydrogenase family)
MYAFYSTYFTPHYHHHIFIQQASQSIKSDNTKTTFSKRKSHYPSTMAPQVWFITGANAGFGLAVSLKAIREGDSVIAAVRSPSKVPESLKAPNVSVIEFDLSWGPSKMEAAMKIAYDAFGRIDVLFNNAGFGQMGAIEETTDEETKAQFDINVFGVLRTCRAALPYLRSQKSGTILNVSSIGGLRSGPACGLYCATKFAIEGLTQTLSAELEPFGIRAICIEPGYFRTAFLSDVSAGGNQGTRISAYEGTISHQVLEIFAAVNGNQPGNPEIGADRIWEAVHGVGLMAGKKILQRLPLGSDAGAQLANTAQELLETAKEYEDVWKSTDY